MQMQDDLNFKSLGFCHPESPAGLFLQDDSWRILVLPWLASEAPKVDAEPRAHAVICVGADPTVARAAWNSFRGGACAKVRLLCSR